jgi:ribosome maturation factor RimP
VVRRMLAAPHRGESDKPEQRSSADHGGGLHCPESAITRQARSTTVCRMASLSQSRLRELVEPVVETAGYDLEEITVSPAGRRSVVRVVVDRDGGVDLDAVAQVSRAVSVALDQTDAFGEAAYVLEVTSPGVDRPLTEPRHWRRNIGRMVATGETTGRISAADETGVTIDVDGQSETIGFSELGHGRVIVEFRHHEDAP